MKCQLYGSKRPSTLNIMGSYAASLAEVEGQKKEVAQLHCNAWLQKWALLGQTHPDTLMSMKDYQMSLRAVEGKDQEAAEMDQHYRELTDQ